MNQKLQQNKNEKCRNRNFHNFLVFNVFFQDRELIICEFKITEIP